MRQYQWLKNCSCQSPHWFSGTLQGFLLTCCVLSVSEAVCWMDRLAVGYSCVRLLHFSLFDLHTSWQFTLSNDKKLPRALPRFRHKNIHEADSFYIYWILRCLSVHSERPVALPQTQTYCVLYKSFSAFVR